MPKKKKEDNPKHPLTEKERIARMLEEKRQVLKEIRIALNKIGLFSNNDLEALCQEISEILEKEGI